MADSSNQARVDRNDGRKLFLGGLSHSTDEDMLRNHFSMFGELEDVVVMREPGTNRPRGFAFVRYVSEDSVERALAAESHNIDNRNVEPKRAQQKSERGMPTTNRSGSGKQAQTASRKENSGPQGGLHGASGFGGEGRPAPRTGKGTGRSPNNQGSSQPSESGQPTHSGKSHGEEYAYNKIFVGGLHYETRDPEFRAYFEQYGPVMAAEVMINRETNKSRGFGFIVFEQESSAIAACEVTDHKIRDKEVEVKRAIPRSKLAPGTPAASIPEQLESQMMQERQQARAMQEQAAVAFAAGYTLPPQLQPVPQMISMQQRQRRSPSHVSPSSVAQSATPSAATVASSTSKPAAAAITGTARPAAAPTSYAAALKGTSAAEKTTASNPLQQATPAPHSSAGAATLQSLINYNNNQQQGVSPTNSGNKSLGPSLSSMDRQQQEPLGSSALNGEIISPEAMGVMGRAGAITKSTSNSNPSSRSNSMALPAVDGKTPGTPLSNLPWLSSPPSNPLVAADGTSDGLNLTLPPAALGDASSYSQAHWLDPAQHAQMLANQQQQMYGQFSNPHMMFMHQPASMPGAGYGAMPPMGAPQPPGGGAVSPELWHHLLQQQQHQQATAHLNDPASHTQAGAAGLYGSNPFVGHYPYFQQPDLSNLSPHQMMFLNAQQQALQASYQTQMQQLQQYQNQLMQQYGNLQQQQHAVAAQHHSSHQHSPTAGSAAPTVTGPPPGISPRSGTALAAAAAGADGPKPPPGMTGGVPPALVVGASAPVPSTQTGGGKSEGTESDELLRSFNELHRESPAFMPNQTWMRR